MVVVGELVGGSCVWCGEGHDKLNVDYRDASEGIESVVAGAAGASFCAEGAVLAEEVAGLAHANVVGDGCSVVVEFF